MIKNHYPQLKELSENLQICPVALYLPFSILVYNLQTLKLWTVDKEYKKLVMQQKNDSCVDRGVSQKSSGYFFLDAIEWREKISKDEKVVTWKYVVQTPFLATYPRLTVQSAVLNILAEKILPDCDCIYFDPYDDVDDVLELPVQQYFNFDKKYEEDAYVYDWKMRANFVRGYWEIELFITRELKIPAKYQLHYCQKKRSDELKKLDEGQ